MKRIWIAIVIAAVALAIYGISIFIGGLFHDFCRNAIIWVLLGIGIAAYFSYYNQNEKSRKD